MNVIRVKSTVLPRLPNKTSTKRILINGRSKKTSTTQRSLRERTRAYFASENNFEFAIEALLFAIIGAISSVADL
jgi:hypothetical protein